MNSHIVLLVALVIGSGVGSAGAATDPPPCVRGAASAPAADCPHAPMHQQRQGRQHGHARWGANYTPGWMLMTPAERTDFAAKMRGANTYDECQTLMVEHHREIETRAKAANQQLPPMPRRNACAGFSQPKQ
jgi:hypothetical protein